MTMRGVLQFVLILASIAASASARTVPCETLPQVADIKVGDRAGRWTTIALDSATRRGFVARSGGISVIDLTTSRRLADLLPGQHVNMVVPLPDGALLATGGESGTVSIVDQATGMVRKRLEGLGDPDEAIVQPGSNDVLIVDEERGELLQADPRTGRILRRIALGRKPEMVQADRFGRAWVAMRDDDQIALVDLRRGRVFGHYPLRGCKDPSGLAEISMLHRLVVACGNGVAKVLSDVNGQDLATLAIGPHPGRVFVSPGRAWIASGDSVLSAISLSSSPIIAARYKTRDGARSGIFDTKTRQIYLPHGQVTGQGDQRQLVPGSFAILVLRDDGPVSQP